MTGFIVTAPAADPEEAPIVSGPFWPNIDPATIREAQRIDRPAQPDRRQHIGKPSPQRHMVWHAAGGEQRNAEPRQHIAPFAIVTAIPVRHRAEQRHGEMRLQRRGIGPQPRREIRADILGRDHRHDAALRMRDERRAVGE